MTYTVLSGTLNHTTEMSMIRWICRVKLNDRKKSEELGELLGLGPTSQFDDQKLVG